MKTRLVNNIRSIAYFYNRKTIHTEKNYDGNKTHADLG